MKKFIAIITLLYFNITCAQNLILNNGFESHSANPAVTGEWFKCSGWSNVNNSLGSWPYASPDYLSTAGSGQVALPSSIFASVIPYSGSYIMGLTARYPAAPDFREYLAHALSSPMVIGQTYTVSFYMTNGTANQYSGAGCDRFGVCFSNGPLTQLNHEPINVAPQCELTMDWWSTTWKLVSFTYTATSTYNYMTIGNFKNDANSISTNHVTATQPMGAYYFIDEVTLQPFAPLPVNFLNFEAIENDQHQVDIKWSTASEWNNDFFTVEKSSDASEFISIGVVKAIGNSNAVQHYLLIDENPAGGMNYYRIKQTDLNGNYKYSKIISVNDIDDFIEVENFYADENNFSIQMMVDDKSSSNVTVKMFNMLGQPVYQNSFPTAQQLKFNVPVNSHGIYFINISNAKTNKLIKFKL